jgi:hypothetical protein
MKDQEK